MEVRKKKEPKQTTAYGAWQSSLATNHVLPFLCCYGFELSLKCVFNPWLLVGLLL